MVILTCITWTWRTGELTQWVVAVPILCMVFKALTVIGAKRTRPRDRPGRFRGHFLPSFAGAKQCVRTGGNRRGGITVAGARNVDK